MLSLAAQTVPLREDESGVLRVSYTRVRLDTIVYAFKQGYTAEEMLLQYPSLELADVYGVIAYYLNNQEEVDRYIQERERTGAAERRKIEGRPEYREFRERLLTRRNNLINRYEE